MRAAIILALVLLIGGAAALHIFSAKESTPASDAEEINAAVLHHLFQGVKGTSIIYFVEVSKDNSSYKYANADDNFLKRFSADGVRVAKRSQCQVLMEGGKVVDLKTGEEGIIVSVGPITDLER